MTRELSGNSSNFCRASRAGNGLPHQQGLRMPRAPTAPDKRRSRTGCLTCRTRRRKCDERKPRCENCESKDLNCRYGVNITFIENAAPISLRQNPRTQQRYTRIKFVNDGSSVSASPASGPHPQHGDVSNDIPIYEHPQLSDEHHGRSVLLPAVSLPEKESHNRASTRDGASIDELLASGLHADDLVPDKPIRVLGTSSPQQGDLSMSGSEHRSTSSDRVFSEPLRSFDDLDGENPRRHRALEFVTPSDHGIFSSTSSDVDGHQVSLLRHYRYLISPWLDLADSQSTFGIEVLIRSKQDHHMQAAILGLAACHKSLQDPLGIQGDVETFCSRFSQGSRGDTELISNDTGSIATVLLLAIRDYVFSSPGEWRPVLRKWEPKFGDIVFRALGKALDSAAFWVLFRLDIAACLASKSCLLLDYAAVFPPWTHLDDSFGLLSSRRSPKERLQHAIILLARSIMLVRPSGLESSSVRMRTHSEASTTSVSSRWSSLWTENQRWRSDCPRELLPIFEVKGDLDDNDPEFDSSFPITLFTTALALVANICHHITSLLLLTHKPRLVKPVAIPRSSSSAIWHAQRILGIAFCNDSLESWDPILISGLLMAATRMSHDAQQSAAISMLHRITKVTGFKLEPEIDRLRSEWSLAERDF